MKTVFPKSFAVIAIAFFSFALSGCTHDAGAPIDNTDILEPQNTLESPEKLAGTWIWEQTVMNNDTVVTPIQKGAFALTFDIENNTVSGKTDCNGFGGNYTITEGGIEFGPLAMTEMYCENSQEQEFVNMITESNGYMFDDQENLVLLLQMDSGSVMFSKEVKEATPDMEVACTGANGKWIAEYKECEYTTEKACDAMGGTFNYCASACRHGESESGEPVMCTMQCVPVCMVE